MTPKTHVDIPGALMSSLTEHEGAVGRAWTVALPALIDEQLNRWDLTPDGQCRHGVVALVLPVKRRDGTRAALKIQPVNDETAGEPLALRAWNGAAAVRLRDHDPTTGAMLLERLDPIRPLSTVADDRIALETLTGLLRRLCARKAPDGIRSLASITTTMLDRSRRAEKLLVNVDERGLLRTCADVTAELADEPGDRLLHWDLHYDNVLPVPDAEADQARASDLEVWRAIDPKPLAGDPGFELFPALHNRWADILATGDVTRAVRRRFDLMTDLLDIDRRRAAGWTLARVLQNGLWTLDSGAVSLPYSQVAVAKALLPLAG